MRKTIVSVAVACALGTGVAVIPGCSSTWWQNFQQNPVEQVQTFEAAVEVGLNAAELAWPAILPALPASSQAQAQLQFTNAVSAVNHALQALNDGVNAAVAAQQANPNFTALMQAVSDAVAQVVAIVDLYTQSAPVADGGAAPPPPPAAGGMKVALSGGAASSVADLHAAYNSLSRWGVKITPH